MRIGKRSKDIQATMNHALHNLLWPDSIAIVGAAPTGKHRTRGQLVRYLAGVGYQGRILPVNPSYTEVDGRRCYPSLMAIHEAADDGAGDEIDGEIDVAVLALPAAMIEAGIERCVRARVKFAVILSAGFVEAGAEGAAMQARIAAKSKAGGLRLLGPNCQGFYNTVAGVTTTFSPTVAPAALTPYQPVSKRRVGIVAQSGGIGYSLFARGRAAGLAFSHIISTGNEADLDVAEFLEYLVDDEHTDVVLLFCETVRAPRRFVAALARARAMGKPVIVLKVGRSPAAQRAAASHTAALTGWDTGYRAVFERHGVIQAEHPDEAVALAGVFTTCPLPRGSRAAIVTVSGGGGALMADMLAGQGIALPALSADIQRTIEAYIPAHGAADNPVDLTLNSADLVMPTLELLEKSDEVDLIAVVTQLASGEILPIDPVRMRAILDRQAKPVIAWTYTLPSAAGQKVAAEGGLFLHMDLRNCGRAARALVEYARGQGEDGGAEAANDAVVRSSAQAQAVTGPVIGEHAVRALLARHGQRNAPEALARTVAEAVAAAERIGYPVALKIQSPDLPHKTEAGGVRLNLADHAAVESAFAAILASARAYQPAACIDGVLGQAMAPKGIEVVVGMVNDADFGPIMMLGFGGVAIELFGDVAHAPAPLDADGARALLGKLRSAKLFAGFRGAAPIDPAPLCEFVALVSRIALAGREHIAEMEFNPVVVHADGSGITVADALIVLREGADPAVLDRLSLADAERA